MITLEIPEEVLEALKILVVYCLVSSNNPIYHQAEIINDFLQDKKLI